MSDVIRRVGAINIKGEYNEPIRVQYWDKGCEFGATWYSPIHQDHVVMTHSETGSHIHFADRGSIVYSVPGDAGKRSFAFNCAEVMFERLVRKLNAAYLDTLLPHDEGEVDAPVVQCEERG